MSNRLYKFAGVAACLAAVVGVALWHGAGSPAADNEGNPPAARWVFTKAHVNGKTVADTAGKFPGELFGAPTLHAGEPTDCLELKGQADGISVANRPRPGVDGMPVDAVTVTAWARIDGGCRRGAVLAFCQDDPAAERGFFLGHDVSHFLFGLAAEGADRGKGFMTKLRSRSKFEPGRWYHLAATYDGRVMSLYVNGKLEASSAHQYGPILYPRFPLMLGHYRDEDENAGLTGALKEVALYDRALPAREVERLFGKDGGLAKAAAADVGPVFVVEPYLQYPTTDSIRILWETTVPGSSVVNYGVNNPPTEKAVGKDNDAIHEVKLTGLKPNTKYFYQVATTAAGRTLTGDLLTFQTVGGTDDAVSFAVIGDTQKNPEMTGRLARLAWDRRPHFLMHLGDVVDNGPDKQEWVDELFRPSAELLARVPVFPAIGNHEKNHAHYYKYFSLPEPEYYYRYRYGNVDFFSLDTNKPVKPGSEQYAWLDKELGKSDAKWKVCYHHHPAFTSDEDDYGNTWKGSSTHGDMNVRNLVELYEKHDVDVVFNGHVHFYERSWPIRGGKVDQKKGIVYVTSGGGGGKLENFAPTPVWFKAQLRVDYHYCYVTVHGGTFRLMAFDHQGRLFDSFEISK